MARASAELGGSPSTGKSVLGISPVISPNPRSSGGKKHFPPYLFNTFLLLGYVSSITSCPHRSSSCFVHHFVYRRWKEDEEGSSILSRSSSTKNENDLFHTFQQEEKKLLNTGAPRLVELLSASLAALTDDAKLILADEAGSPPGAPPTLAADLSPEAVLYARVLKKNAQQAAAVLAASGEDADRVKGVDGITDPKRITKSALHTFLVGILDNFLPSEQHRAPAREERAPLPRGARRFTVQAIFCRGVPIVVYLTGGVLGAAGGEDDAVVGEGADEEVVVGAMGALQLDEAAEQNAADSSEEEGVGAGGARSKVQAAAEKKRRQNEITKTLKPASIVWSAEMHHNGQQGAAGMADIYPRAAEVSAKVWARVGLNEDELRLEFIQEVTDGLKRLVASNTAPEFGSADMDVYVSNEDQEGGDNVVVHAVGVPGIKDFGADEAKEKTLMGSTFPFKTGVCKAVLPKP